MLNPKLIATRSNKSKSSILENNAAINEYPGRKSTKGRPRMILNEVKFNGERRMDRIDNTVNKMVSVISSSFSKL